MGADARRDECDDHAVAQFFLGQAPEWCAYTFPAAAHRARSRGPARARTRLVRERLITLTAEVEAHLDPVALEHSEAGVPEEDTSHPLLADAPVQSESP